MCGEKGGVMAIHDQALMGIHGRSAHATVVYASARLARLHICSCQWNAHMACHMMHEAMRGCAAVYDRMYIICVRSARAISMRTLPHACACRSRHVTISCASYVGMRASMREKKYCTLAIIVIVCLCMRLL